MSYLSNIKDFTKSIAATIADSTFDCLISSKQEEKDIIIEEQSKEIQNLIDKLSLSRDSLEASEKAIKHLSRENTAFTIYFKEFKENEQRYRNTETNLQKALVNKTIECNNLKEDYIKAMRINISLIALILTYAILNIIINW